MTYSKFKAAAVCKLKDCPDVSDAVFEAVCLICSVCKISTAEFLAKKSTVLSDDEEKKLTLLLDRRISGEPLQYVIGEWEFCGLRMFCGSGCLIPRPETELIVNKATALLPKNGRLLDLCTGSGCIATAVLNRRTDVTAVGVDISADALIYAEKNAAYHGVRDRFTVVRCDIADYIPPFEFDVIASNPPYVKTQDVDAFNRTMKCEPRIAFDGGKDGLRFYRLIIDRFVNYREIGGLSESGSLLLEAGFDTTEAVAELIKAVGLNAEIMTDFAGIKRAVIGRRTD